MSETGMIRPGRPRTAAAASIACLLAVPAARGDDWPQWRGPNRDGIWRESGTLQTLPPSGPKVLWRVRIGAGYSGPVVAQGRVYLTDRQLRPDVERVLCLDERTGKLLWAHAYPCDYEGMAYGSGPRASPTVHDGKVYTFGARGHLFCLDAISGSVAWKKDLVKEYNARVPTWGTSAAPLLEGGLVIVCAGGQPGASMMAFDRNTGKEVWRALDDRPAYSAPIAVDAGGKRQLIVRTADSVSSLDPATGQVYWQIPWKMPDPYLVIASPVVRGDLLLCVSGWSKGAKMLKLDRARPGAAVLWEDRARPHAMMCTPFFLDDGHFCVVNTQGALCCHDAATGKELWATQEPTSNSPVASAHLTPNGDRVWIFNHLGHLIVARVTPQGYKELGRCLLVEPTAGTRAQGAVTWSHPAYADRCVLARNDRELVRASLDPKETTSAGVAEQAPAARARVFGNFTGRNATLAMARSPDGKTLALSNWAATVKLFDLATGKELPSPPRFRYWMAALAFSPDGKLLATGGGNEFTKASEVKLWDAARGTGRAPLSGHTDKVLAAAFSPDGKTLATGSVDRTVRLWDVAAAKERAVLSGHTDAVWCVAFSRDGKTLASAGWDRTVRLWDPATGKPRGTLAGHEEEVLALAIAADGKTIATGGADWTVRLWDVATARQRAVLGGHHGAVCCAAFSPDGAVLATGGGDETLKLWDAATGKERATLRGHRSGISALAFTPDGKTLISAGREDAVRLWTGF